MTLGALESHLPGTRVGKEKTTQAVWWYVPWDYVLSLRKKMNLEPRMGSV